MPMPTINTRDALFLPRAGIIALTFLMLILDSVHISQLKRTWTQQGYLPWSFSAYLCNPGTPFDGPPHESDLQGYYSFLLLPDLFVMAMMVWLVVARKCSDKMYHAGLRVLFLGTAVVWVMWYLVAEIKRIRRYTERMYGHLGVKKRSDVGDVSMPENQGNPDQGFVDWGALQQKQQQQEQDHSFNPENGLLFPSIVSLSPPNNNDTTHPTNDNNKNNKATTLPPSTLPITPTLHTGAAATAPAAPALKSPLPLSTNTDKCSIGDCQGSSTSTFQSSHLEGGGYEWTPPSSGSVYFCFINHLDVAPYAPLINCGVYRTRNIFAIFLMLMLIGEGFLSYLKGDMPFS